MNATPAVPAPLALADEDLDDGPAIGLVDLLAWIGEAKRPIAVVTVAAGLVALVVALLLPVVFTARAT